VKAVIAAAVVVAGVLSVALWALDRDALGAIDDAALAPASARVGGAVSDGVRADAPVAQRRVTHEEGPGAAVGGARADHARAPLAALIETPQGVSVGAADIVATVNGAPVLGRDVLPFLGAGARSLAPETLRRLRQRAIERELVLQAADAAGITLGDTERARLAALRASYEPGGEVIAMEGGAEQAALAARDAEALLLRKALLAREGAEPPWPGEDEVRAHYARHVARYGTLPEGDEAAWRALEPRVRRELTAERRDAYQARVEAWLEALGAAATVVVAGSARETAHPRAQR